MAIKTATAPLVARLSSVEQRLASLPVPKDGVDGKDGAPGEAGPAGKDADASEIWMLKADVELLRKELAEKDGARALDTLEIMHEAVKKAVAEIPKPKDGAPGQSIDPEDVDAMVAAHLTKAMSDQVFPNESDICASVLSELSKSVQPMVAAEVKQAVGALPVPKDGVGVAEVFIDYEGHLIQTMTDGRTKDVGVVVGRDADMEALRATIMKTLDSWPKPKDGKDGLGFDDLEAVFDEHGRLSLKFSRGDESKTFRVPCSVYRGIYRPDQTYEKGDVTTFGGSGFIAQKDGALGKPAECDDWKMIVQRGRDARTPVAVKHG